MATSERARISPIAAAAAASTCSQLSTTISRRRPATVSATVSMTRASRPAGVMPSGGAIASGTASASPDRRQLDHPDAVGELARRAARPTASASRVLPDASDPAQRDERMRSGPAPRPRRQLLRRARRAWSRSAAGCHGRACSAHRVQSGRPHSRRDVARNDAGAGRESAQPTQREALMDRPDAAGARRGRELNQRDRRGSTTRRWTSSATARRGRFAGWPATS